MDFIFTHKNDFKSSCQEILMYNPTAVWMHRNHNLYIHICAFIIYNLKKTRKKSLVRKKRKQSSK